MVGMTNNHNLFPLPYWAPALWRVPIPLRLLNEAYARGPRVQKWKSRKDVASAARDICRGDSRAKKRS
jgi:hypothetical protein